MGLFKKNNKWWIDYYMNGERIRRSISTGKAEAQKVLTKIQSEIIHKKYALPKDEKIKFNEISLRFVPLLVGGKKNTRRRLLK